MKKWAILLALMLLFSSAAALADSLYQLAAPHGFDMGAAITYQQFHDQNYLNLVKQHFSTITPTNELKAYTLLDQWGCRRSEDGMPVMNYRMADDMVAWAQENGIRVRGHVLVWDAYMCDWYFREGYDSSKPYADATTIQKRTKSYITQVITHFEEKFPGVVYCWDVVNEAVGDGITDYAPGDPRHLRTVRNGAPNLFQKYMGDDYVALSFLYARNAVEALGADIDLYYNDYNAYFNDKALAMVQLARSVNNFAIDANGQPRKLMDGIGMQGYIGGYGTQSGCLVNSHLQQIKTAIQRYEAEGLKVQITEMAVRNFEKDRAQQHAEFYANLFEKFMSLHTENGNPLNNVSIWGLIDYPKEPKGTYTYNLNSPYGGLFDEKLNEKEVLHAVCEQLKK
ncbi:MAG: endo-1,4-beta-xylanase [bacterium]|nr:endo-1,4-beta-xylanase [bacterium]